MMSFRVKQIAVALCLMMSLLIGHASACFCPRHIEKKAVEMPDCHSQHETVKAETVEAVDDGLVCDTNCICASDRHSSFIAANQISKKFSRTDTATETKQIRFGVEFRAATAYVEPSSEFVNDPSYLNTLRPFLPARAPPRL